MKVNKIKNRNYKLFKYNLLKLQVYSNKPFLITTNFSSSVIEQIEAYLKQVLKIKNRNYKVLNWQLVKLKCLFWQAKYVVYYPQLQKSILKWYLVYVFLIVIIFLLTKLPYIIRDLDLIMCYISKNPFENRVKCACEASQMIKPGKLIVPIIEANDTTRLPDAPLPREEILTSFPEVELVKGSLLSLMPDHIDLEQDDHMESLNIALRGLLLGDATISDDVFVKITDRYTGKSCNFNPHFLSFKRIDNEYGGDIIRVRGHTPFREEIYDFHFCKPGQHILLAKNCKNLIIETRPSWEL